MPRPRPCGARAAAARGATLYATLEPCSHHGKTPPCADAIIAAGIARVVSAIEDPNPEVAGRGYARLRAAGIEVTIGRLRGRGAPRPCRTYPPHSRRPPACHAETRGVVGRQGRSRRDEDPPPITGEETRARVHLMRAMNDAILTGIGTVLSDDPALTCRLPGMASDNRRCGWCWIAICGCRSLSVLARTAKHVPVWVFCGEGAPVDREQALDAIGVIVLRTKAGEGGLDLHAVLQALAARGITRLMVEVGPKISASFLRADLVDEALLLRGPSVIGPDGIDALDGLPLSALTGSPKLKQIGIEQVGADSHHHFERP